MEVKTFPVEQWLDYINNNSEEDICEVKKMIVSSKDLESKRVIKPEYLIESLLPVQGLSFLVGPSGSRKSQTAIYWAECVANAKQVYNKYKVKQGRVLYVNEEMNEGTLQMYSDEIKKALKVYGTSTDVDYTTFNDLKFNSIKDISYKKLKTLMSLNRYDLIIFDSMKRFIEFEENNADEVSKWYNTVVKPFYNNYKTSILMIHHAKKEQLGKTQYTINKRDLIRGSSDFANICDMINYIDIIPKARREQIKLYQIKNRCEVEMDDRVINVHVLHKTVNGKKVIDMLGFSEDRIEVDRTMDNVVERLSPSARIICEYLVKSGCEYITSKQIHEHFDQTTKNTKGIPSRTVTSTIKKLEDESVLLKVPDVRGKYEFNNIFNKEVDKNGK